MDEHEKRINDLMDKAKVDVLWQLLKDLVEKADRKRILQRLAEREEGK